MAQVDSGTDSGPANESGESNYLAALQADADASFAALDEPAPQSAEATADAPTGDSSETVVSDAQSPVPESVVDAELAGNDDEVITRRNARELVEKARAEKEEALSRAAELAQAKADADARQASLLEQSQQWNPPAEHYQAIERAVKARDWATLDAIHWTDDQGNEYQGFNSLDGALDYLQSLDKRSEKNASMLDYWRQAFMANTGATWNAMAGKDGVDKTVLLGPDMAKSLEHLYDAGRAAGESEWKGKHDAILAEYNALKARSGSFSPSPESGGAGATSSAIPRTIQELERMDLRDFDKNFDKILASIPNR